MSSDATGLVVDRDQRCKRPAAPAPSRGALRSVSVTRIARYWPIVSSRTCDIGDRSTTLGPDGS